MHATGYLFKFYFPATRAAGRNYKLYIRSKKELMESLLPSTLSLEAAWQSLAMSMPPFPDNLYSKLYYRHARILEATLHRHGHGYGFGRNTTFFLNKKFPDMGTVSVIYTHENIYIYVYLINYI